MEILAIKMSEHKIFQYHLDMAKDLIEFSYAKYHRHKILYRGGCFIEVLDNTVLQ
jgi:hypothetical protein